MNAKIIPVDPFDLVVFGGTGDLAMHRLLPGLYHRDLDGQLKPECRIIAVARGEHPRDSYAGMIVSALEQSLGGERLDQLVLDRFLRRLDYVQIDVESNGGWQNLVDKLPEPRNPVRIYYLATDPSLFGPICHGLSIAGLNSRNARVVLEKPLGHDLKSAQAINKEVREVFDEEQIYRIDHYLGKETVQNLITLRFANSIFELIWNRFAIDHVQIIVAEDIGVGERLKYDGIGALRDMVQNHILQLMCLVAMEPPTSLERLAMRNEKIKILHALKPITEANVVTRTVRGQYRAGTVGGQPVPSYTDDVRVGQSNTETFVVVKAELQNWRWHNVPFYLCTGKRLAKRVSKIVIQFQDIPYSIFDEFAHQIVPNRLVLSLLPDEAIKLYLMTKDPGPGGWRLQSESLDLPYSESFVRYPNPYESLLMDVVRGNLTLFMHLDEVEAAWNWIDPILAGWRDQNQKLHIYDAGSSGPNEATALIATDKRRWFEDAP